MLREPQTPNDYVLLKSGGTARKAWSGDWIVYPRDHRLTMPGSDVESPGVVMPWSAIRDDVDRVVLEQAESRRG